MYGNQCICINVPTCIPMYTPRDIGTDWYRVSPNDEKIKRTKWNLARYNCRNSGIKNTGMPPPRLKRSHIPPQIYPMSLPQGLHSCCRYNQQNQQCIPICLRHEKPHRTRTSRWTRNGEGHNLWRSDQGPPLTRTG